MVNCTEKRNMIWLLEVLADKEFLYCLSMHQNSYVRSPNIYFYKVRFSKAI